MANASEICHVCGEPRNQPPKGFCSAVHHRDGKRLTSDGTSVSLSGGFWSWEHRRPKPAYHYPLGDPRQKPRDIRVNPYTPDEHRVANYFFHEVGVGGGDDPVGSLITAHAFMVQQLRERREASLRHNSEDWLDEDPGSCIHCGKSWELVRPGKSQPTCDCHTYCWNHTPPVKLEQRASDHPSGISGEVCPECWKEFDKCLTPPTSP